MVDKFNWAHFFEYGRLVSSFRKIESNGTRYRILVIYVYFLDLIVLSLGKS